MARNYILHDINYSKVPDIISKRTIKKLWEIFSKTNFMSKFLEKIIKENKLDKKRDKSFSGINYLIECLYNRLWSYKINLIIL